MCVGLILDLGCSLLVRWQAAASFPRSNLRPVSLWRPETSPARALGHDFGGVCRSHKVAILAGEPHLDVSDLSAPANDDALEPQTAAPHRTVVGDVQVRP